MLDFRVSIFQRGMIQLLPANAAEFSKWSRIGMAKNRRAQIVLSEEDRRRHVRIRSSTRSPESMSGGPTSSFVSATAAAWPGQ